ncbi:hypothetical protein RSOLAG1IB_11621 [Rhizoctonia solani AG-1 IB]|uniref:Uncharacterized protein n=1 Tax=Thanatephorus cucumeris (strain AG1-IB / isolate 7/3/14) TaxID=1108050 RepID=A0A0B7FDF9_THACB|nr:hypothetical protein RSOLAG1IB_11621 [Rhizoctonia solani AG-1 IB]
MVREVSLHSDSEELSIYRAMSENELHHCAEDDQAAHRVMKEAFKHVDSSSVSKLGIYGYAEAVQRACEVLFKHAEEEERDHYKKLSSILDPLERSHLATDFLKARSASASRPHPSAPQGDGIGQRLMEKMVKRVDSVINKARNDVPLKYQRAYVDAV